MGYLSKRGSRAARVCLACATAVAVTVVGIGQAPPSYAAPGTVTGSVFQDFDGDGTRDAGDTAAGVQTDLAIAGIHGHRVRRAQRGGRRPQPPQPTAPTRSTPPRSPTGRRCGSSSTTPTAAPRPCSGDYQSSFHGANNGTSVQFAAAGDEDVDFGVLEPEDYAANNAPIITAIQYAGLRTASGLHQSAGRRGQPLGRAATNRPRPRTALPGPRRPWRRTAQVGSVWGTAFDRRQNAAYVAASYKRISDLGPLGLGGIYRIPDVLDQTTGALNRVPRAPSSTWLDVATLCHGVDVGTVPQRRRRGLGTPNAPDPRRRRLPARPARSASAGSRSPRTARRCSSSTCSTRTCTPSTSTGGDSADHRHLHPARPRRRTSDRGPWPCTATGSTSATSTPAR